MLEKFLKSLFGQNQNDESDDAVSERNTSPLTHQTPHVTPADAKVSYIFFSMALTASRNPELVKGLHAIKLQSDAQDRPVELVACSDGNPNQVAYELFRMGVTSLTGHIYCGNQTGHEEGLGHSSAYKAKPGFWDRINLPSGPDSYIHVDPKQIFLVDDYKQNVANLTEAGGNGFVFRETCDRRMVDEKDVYGTYNKPALDSVKAHLGL